ncbi:phosphoribosylformylglycinamidine synthase subunit PurS [Myxococcota bacterium]|nr:phosphoribosylformylglycinamidine synthase subunit PurS [Myxococcota bacterium]
MKARVYVTLRQGVLDPQGRAVLHALSSLGFDQVRDARIGKYVELEIADGPRDEAEKAVREMARRLLANPVIEDFRVEIPGEGEAR